MEPFVFTDSGLVEDEEERQRLARAATDYEAALASPSGDPGADWAIEDLPRLPPYDPGPSQAARAEVEQRGRPAIRIEDGSNPLAARGSATAPPAAASPHPTAAGGSPSIMQMEPMTFPAPPAQSPPGAQQQNLGRQLGDPRQPTPPEAPERPPEVSQSDSPRGKLARLLTNRQQQPNRDYTGVDVADAVASPFRGLARGLIRASGHSPGPSQTWGQQARARDRQSDQDALRSQQAQAQLRNQGTDRDLALRRLAMQERGQASLEEHRNRMDARLDEQSERQASTAEVRARAGMAVARARVQAMRSEAEREAAALDPASEPSQMAQLALRTALSGYPADARQRLQEQLGVSSLDEHIAGLNMRAAEQLMGDLREMFRDLAHRRGGRGGGGTNIARTPPEWFAGTPDEWRRLGATGQRQEIQRHLHPRPSDAGDDGRIEIAPGVYSSLDRLRGSDAAQLARGISTARAQSANIRGIGEIASRYPVGANINPQARAELTPRLTIARGMVATLGQTGVINATEVPTINAALPNPADLEQMTFGTFQARMRSWQRILEERVRADLETNGVDEAGVNRVLSWLRGSGGGGGSRPQTSTAPSRAGGPQSDRVRVRHPDGRSGSIPRERLEAARAAGFEVVDGS